MPRAAASRIELTTRFLRVENMGLYIVLQMKKNFRRLDSHSAHVKALCLTAPASLLRGAIHQLLPLVVSAEDSLPISCLHAASGMTQSAPRLPLPLPRTFLLLLADIFPFWVGLLGFLLATSEPPTPAVDTRRSIAALARFKFSAFSFPRPCPFIPLILPLR